MDANTQSRPSMKILIIDDDAGVLEGISMIFKMAGGFDVFTLTDATQWRETVEKVRPDAVLVDYRMPKMNGDMVVQALNTSELRSGIKTIALFSATPLSPDQVQSFGADLFFEKPFDVDQLMESLRSAVQKRNSEIKAAEDTQKRATG